MRQHLQQAFRTDAEVRGRVPPQRAARLGFLRLVAGTQVKVLEGPSDFYYEEIRGAQFCLCPRGFATWSRRLVDAILIGFARAPRTAASTHTSC